MYPGIQCITKKHNLARNLMRMSKVFPSQYDFFPKTWVLPQEMLNLRTQFSKQTVIVKPDSLCQGKGIFLSNNIDFISEITCNQSENPWLEDQADVGYVVQ